MRENRPITNVEDARAYVRDCVFQPRMRFDTYHGAWMGDDAFTLTLFVEVADSDFPPSYNVDRDEIFDETTYVRLSEVPTEDHLARRMIELYKVYLDSTWEHEAREFLRVLHEGEYVAPFHPHHDGQEHHGYNVGDARYRKAGVLHVTA
jgi:hypothetical protein